MDQKNAYDRVDKEVLLQVMEKFEVGRKTIVGVESFNEQRRIYICHGSWKCEYYSERKRIQGNMLDVFTAIQYLHGRSAERSLRKDAVK